MANSEKSLLFRTPNNSYSSSVHLNASSKRSFLQEIANRTSHVVSSAVTPKKKTRHISQTSENYCINVSASLTQRERQPGQFIAPQHDQPSNPADQPLNPTHKISKLVQRREKQHSAPPITPKTPRLRKNTLSEAVSHSPSYGRAPSPPTPNKLGLHIKPSIIILPQPVKGGIPCLTDRYFRNPRCYPDAAS